MAGSANASNLLQSDAVRQVHTSVEKEWDLVRRSACQTAAGRPLWKHVIHDPLGETYLRNLHDKIKKDYLINAHEISGVILAVRPLWFDSLLEDGLSSPNVPTFSQVVLLGAGMDTRAYRLSCLKDSDVFEVDFGEVLEAKTKLLEAAKESTQEQQHTMSKAKSLTREELQNSGFLAEKSTVWVLEGILYYLTQSHAMQVLRIIAEKGVLTPTLLLADFMNKPSTAMSNSAFHLYSNWPDHLLPSLGFNQVKLSQIGDPDAHFGLMNDPLNLFNKLRRVPRSLQTHPDDRTPCCLLYLVEASRSTHQNQTTASTTNVSVANSSLISIV